MNNYIINNDTLIIIPLSKNKSKVVELENEFIVNESTTEIVNKSCLYFGSSLLGRIEGTKYLMNCYYKLPIIVSDYNKLIIFPTLSYKSNDCSWINLNSIKEYYKENNTTNIVFNNDKLINISNSFSSFENQYYRSLKYKNLIEKK